MQLLQDILIARKKHKLALRNRARRFDENRRYKEGIKLGMNENDAFKYAWNKKYLEKWNKRRLKAQAKATAKANAKEEKEYNDRMRRNTLIKSVGQQAERKTHLLKLKGISIKKYPKAYKTHRKKHLLKIGNRATIERRLHNKAMGRRWKGR